MCITLTQNFSKVAENIAQLYRDDRKKNIFSTSGAAVPGGLVLRFGVQIQESTQHEKLKGLMTLN